VSPRVVFVAFAAFVSAVVSFDDGEAMNICVLWFVSAVRALHDDFALCLLSVGIARREAVAIVMTQVDLYATNGADLSFDGTHVALEAFFGGEDIGLVCVHL